MDEQRRLLLDYYLFEQLIIFDVVYIIKYVIREQ